MDCNDHYAKLHSLAAETAPRLGLRYQPPQPEREHRAVLIGDHEQRLLWCMRVYPQHRVEIMGDFPRWGDRDELTLRSPERRPRITVSPDCTPERAAREITRRLLPSYLSQLELARKQRDEFHTERAARETIADRLRDAGAIPTSDPAVFHLPLPKRTDESFSHGELSISRHLGDISIELRWIRARRGYPNPPSP